ncbi:MAG: hypothetical protein DRO14_04690 [Thermoprotei archaeon]|nr:MAG: hypothetical protein DRO14_04690 [Thermoprotei archaeon]
MPITTIGGGRGVEPRDIWEYGYRRLTKKRMSASDPNEYSTTSTSYVTVSTLNLDIGVPNALVWIRKIKFTREMYSTSYPVYSRLLIEGVAFCEASLNVRDYTSIENIAHTDIVAETDSNGILQVEVQLKIGSSAQTGYMRNTYVEIDAVVIENEP